MDPADGVTHEIDLKELSFLAKKQRGAGFGTNVLLGKFHNVENCCGNYEAESLEIQCQNRLATQY